MLTATATAAPAAPATPPPAQAPACPGAPLRGRHGFTGTRVLPPRLKID